MRVLVTFAAFAVLAAGAGGAFARQTAGAPALGVVRNAPLTLRGSGFHAGERVLVTVRMGETRLARRARAGAGGGFTVSWPGVRLLQCSPQLVLRARGAQSGVVDAELGHPDCAMQ